MSGKIAVLSGVTRGEGVKVVLHLANAGYDICVLSHQDAAAASLRKSVVNIGRQCYVFSCRVEDDSELTATFSKIMTLYDHIDIMFINMGQMPDSEHYPRKTVGDLSAKEWQDYLNSALMGVINSVHAAVRVMRGNTQPSYIFTTAPLGITAEPLRGLYTVSRYAIKGLVETVNAEAQKFNYPMHAHLLVPDADKDLAALTTDVLGIDR